LRIDGETRKKYRERVEVSGDSMRMKKDDKVRIGGGFFWDTGQKALMVVLYDWIGGLWVIRDGEDLVTTRRRCTMERTSGVRMALWV